MSVVRKCNGGGIINMEFAIRSLEELIKKHKYDLEKAIEFFKSEKFDANTLEGASEFAIKNAKNLYEPIFEELNEAIEILRESEKTEQEKLVEIMNEYERENGRKVGVILVRQGYLETLTGMKYIDDLEATFNGVPIRVYDGMQDECIFVEL